MRAVRCWTRRPRRRGKHTGRRQYQGHPAAAHDRDTTHTVREVPSRKQSGFRRRLLSGVRSVNLGLTCGRDVRRCSASCSPAARASGCCPSPPIGRSRRCRSAGSYRLVDFALSNLVNAGYLRIVVLTQYKSHSLDRHIATTWRLSPLLGNYVAPVPAQMRRGPRWFAGSADAIFQSLNLVHDERPDYVCVFGADHIYRMDPAQMVDAAHRIGRGRDGGRRSACRSREAEPVRRDRDRPPTGVDRQPSARSRRDAAGCRTRPTRCSRRWATTSSTPRR